MAVRERGNAWQADVIVSGRRVRKDFRTREAADEWERKMRAELEATRRGRRRRDPPQKPSAETPGGGGKSIPRTLGDLMERTFNFYYRRKTWAHKTWNMIERVLDHFGRDFPLSRMDKDAVDGFIEALRAQGKAGSTINGRLAVLSKALRYAHDLGALDRLPRIEREDAHVVRMRWLSGEQEERLLCLFRQWGREDAAEVVEVLIDTGLRQSELWALTPRDVSLDPGGKSGTIRVWQAAFSHLDAPIQRTKNNEMRTIYMTERVARIIARRLAETKPHERLFPYDNFWLRTPWDRARAVMGLTHDPNFVPYICRHTCASRLVQRGVALPIIQRWMGHRTLQVTMRYANVAPDNLREAAETLNMGAADKAA